MVWFFTLWFPTGRDPTPTFILELIEAICAGEDHAVVHVARGGRWGGLQEVRPGVVSVRVPGWLPRHAAEVLGFLVGAWRLRRRCGRPRLVHGFTYPPGAAALLLRLVWPIRVVVTEEWSRLLARDPRRLPLGGEALARLVYRRADAVTAVGEALAAAIRRRAPGRPVHVVPNGVDVRVFRPGPGSARGGRLEVVMACGLDWYKRVEDAVAAVAALRARGRCARLTVAGPGDPGPCREVARRLGLSGDDVVLAGPVDRAGVTELMRRADVLVVASQFETFCTAAAEALACGTPVVATRCGGPEDFVCGEAGELVDVGDVDALAAAIWRVGRGERSAQALHRYAADRFALPVVAARMRAIHASLGGGPTCAPSS
jgi:glycosyltransferase involved in cell wall biosynthesis